ncbi:transmembrane protein 273 isoform X3 [Physeter macrocephalus]|uniref:Transmembrane protein 273 isoform X3 n=1 Tax=Physeter macrocephalus TaxID=9755 RepID=A0A455AZL6_PHYMC|nr:transmembrane protein 273 isoform X3 [Physeter catodon]|eukprot:XP_028342095.1 transmembrane protein 273 isoform X5 [Physeter catodon]
MGKYSRCGTPRGADVGAAQVLATGQPAGAKIVAAATSPGQQDLPGFRGLAGVSLHTHGPILSPPQGSAHQAVPLACHLLWEGSWLPTGPPQSPGIQISNPPSLGLLWASPYRPASWS